MGRTQNDSRQLRLGRFLLGEFRNGAESVSVSVATEAVKITDIKQTRVLLRRHFYHLLLLSEGNIFLNPSEKNPTEELEEVINLLETETYKSSIESPVRTINSIEPAKITGRERR